MNRLAWLGAFAVALLLSAPSQASGFLEEIRLGIYQHDTGIIGKHKEEGIDYALEGLTRPIQPLWFIGTPRLVYGGAWNSAGQTSQIYVGIDKQLDFLHGTFMPGDSFFVEGTIGGVWHSGKHDLPDNSPEAAHWKSHGGSFLFRPGLALGYRINEHWSVAASLNHISNANLGSRNEGSNNLGILIGWKL